MIEFILWYSTGILGALVFWFDWKRTVDGGLDYPSPRDILLILLGSILGPVLLGSSLLYLALDTGLLLGRGGRGE